MERSSPGTVEPLEGLPVGGVQIQAQCVFTDPYDLTEGAVVYMNYLFPTSLFEDRNNKF